MVDSTEDKTPTDDKVDDSASDSPDLDKVDDDSLQDLDEESKKIVKGFQKDYTKKTQSIAQKEKDFAEREKALEDKLAVGDKWYEFEKNPENAKLVEEFNTWKANKGKEPEPTDDDDGDDDFVDPAVKTLRKSVAKQQQEMNDLAQATKVSSKMMIDLMSEVQSKRYKDVSFEIDPRAVLTYARENNIFDMKKAIEGCYSDPIKEDEYAKRLAAAEEKWEEKHKTTVLGDAMPLGRQVRKVIARKRGSEA